MPLMEKRTILFLRSAVFFLIVFALTIPQLLLQVKGTDVLFLVDRSASMANTDQDVLAWIEKSVDEKGKDDRYAIVSFGKNTSTEQSFTKKNEVISQFSSEIEQSDTSIESAVRFGSSYFSNERSGRMVLFSDGNETIGNAVDTVKLLQNKNIELDIVPMEIAKKKDISIQDFSVPPSLYQGERVELAVALESTATERASIRISVNNQEIMKKNVNVKEGKNVVSFSHVVKETGMQVYKAELLVDDAFTENNILHAITQVKGVPKVLLVEEKESVMSRILKGNGFVVDSTVPEKIPTNLAGILNYQSIIFNDISATNVTEQQMELIEKSVKDFGNGFIMTGGENSFGLGGYFKTPIEKLLPVDMDIKGKKELPSLGLIIVLDRSGSMDGNKLSLAKEAAARTVELLDDGDTFGFIAFDDRPWQIVETQILHDKEAVTDQILSLTPGGGTEIFSSLELAYQQLSELEVQRKHIILLTDGQSNSTNQYEALLSDGKEQKITLSTVAIGSDADKQLLENLANWGAGRYYDAIDSSVIPSILSRETVMTTKTYIEDEPFFPQLKSTSGWTTLFNNGVPEMNAYIATSIKDRAKEVLISAKDDPVLAEWQYGKGTTLAFTSDVTGKWSGQWPRWHNWGIFLNQLVTKSLPKYDSEPYSLTLNHSGDETIVSIQADSSNLNPLSASVVSDKGEEIKHNLKLVAPGQYEMTVPKDAGIHFLSLQQENMDGSSNVYQTGFSIPYSKEYLQQGMNKRAVENILAQSRGKQLVKEKDAFRNLKVTPKNKKSLSEWLLLAAFVLLFMEILIRRFGLKRLLPNKKNIKKPTHVETTIPHIERVKQSVQTKTNVAKPPKVEQPKQKQKKKSNPKAMETEREEKMKRLLEAKRRK